MNTNKLTMGWDLGDRRHNVCILYAAGAVVTEEAITNTRWVKYGVRFCSLWQQTRQWVLGHRIPPIEHQEL